MSDAAASSATGFATLAEWGASLRFDDIPYDVKGRAALVLVDDLGAAVGSRHEPELQRMARLLPAGAPEATVLSGEGLRTDRASAAMLNTIAANWCQLDEGHRGIMCHAGLYSVFAAAAEAEATGATVRELLRAVVISYEIVCRFAQTWRFQPPTLHPHAAWSAIGAAAAVAALRRLDVGRFNLALSSAATTSMAGPFAHGPRGALIQNTWAGLGVWTGFRCVDWSGLGIGGLPSSPYDVFATVLSSQCGPEALTASLGTDWALRGGYHKLYSCAQQSHAAVEAMLRLCTRWPPGKGPANVTEITVDVHQLALAMDNRQPLTTLAARFSVPHVVATVCILGRADAEAFAVETLNHPEILRIREMVQLRLFEPSMAWPHDRPARLRVVLDDGTMLVETCLSAEGGPDRPFTSDIILRKAALVTQDVYPRFTRTANGLVAVSNSILEKKWDDIL